MPGSNLQSRTERRVQIAGLLVIAGLAIQLATIAWNHHLAFLAFAVVGAPVALAGILVYLLSLPGLKADDASE